MVRANRGAHPVARCHLREKGAGSIKSVANRRDRLTRTSRRPHTAPASSGAIFVARWRRSMRRLMLHVGRKRHRRFPLVRKGSVEIVKGRRNRARSRMGAHGKRIAGRKYWGLIQSIATIGAAGRSGILPARNKAAAGSAVAQLPTSVVGQRTAHRQQVPQPDPKPARRAPGIYFKSVPARFLVGLGQR